MVDVGKAEKMNVYRMNKHLILIGFSAAKGLKNILERDKIYRSDQ
jgi:hypothetical protein